MISLEKAAENYERSLLAQGINAVLANNYKLKWLEKFAPYYLATRKLVLQMNRHK